MEVRGQFRSNRVIMQCSGRMDAAGAPIVERTVLALLEPKPDWRPLPVVLDFAGVTYLSSAGIRTLLILAREAKVKVVGSALAPLRLDNVSPAVAEVLKITGLGDDLGQPDQAARKQARPPAHVNYRYLLDSILSGFPTPVRDPVKEAYFIQAVSRGLDRLGEYKTANPFLGKMTELDYEGARAARFPESGSSLEETIAATGTYLEGMTVWGHPRTQINVAPPPTIASIAGNLFASIYNPNIIWDEMSHKLAQAEVEVSSMCSELIGYDPGRSGGVFTFGGTGTVLYGIKLGIEKALPGALAKGVRQDVKVLASDVAHYAKYSALGWLGVGMDNLVTVPTDGDNSMDLGELDRTLRGLLERGERIACIVATMGTTDAFGIDNLEFIVRLRDRLVDEYKLPYRPHVHADAVIGWAWAVFNDYDFRENPMSFSRRTLRSLWDAQTGIRALGLADSAGIDFHKTGYVPYISSLFLCRERTDLNLVTRDLELMPYLFQFGNYHPGVFTLETSRSGASVLSAWANLKFLGKQGYRAVLGHIVSVAEALRERLSASTFGLVMNDYNYGPVTLFRIYPDGVDARATYRQEVEDPGARELLAQYNEYNRRLFEKLRIMMQEGHGPALSLTERYRTTACGAAIIGLKSYVMSPFADAATMDDLMRCIGIARSQLAHG
ncbi:MAG: STAS domain-containing protein [Candidatus Riflebacteria bacterium]|nr:STAS domain-containing protein [Candidatus Riflebacteria bacterium]